MRQTRLHETLTGGGGGGNIADTTSEITDLASFNGFLNYQTTSLSDAKYVLKTLYDVHGHSALNITSGTLPINRGGTGRSSWIADDGYVFYNNSAGTLTNKSIVSGDILGLASISNLTNYYTETVSDARFAPISHAHSASDITSGTLPINRGGTGRSSWIDDDGYVFYDYTLGTLRNKTIGSGEILGLATISNLTNYYTKTISDGLYSSQSHTHTTTDITNLSSYTGLDARYYTETETDAKYLIKNLVEVPTLNNTRVGGGSLAIVSDGAWNSAFCSGALAGLSTGDFNIGLGKSAGSNCNGNNNIYIGSDSFANGSSADNNTIIGNSTTTNTYVAGISGQLANSGKLVYVNSSHKLGTINGTSNSTLVQQKDKTYAVDRNAFADNGLVRKFRNFDLELTKQGGIILDTSGAIIASSFMDSGINYWTSNYIFGCSTDL